MDTSTETEVKIRVGSESLSEIRQKLFDLGFQLKAERAREENLLMDYADGNLTESGSALRLRKYGDKKVLTFKGPRIEDPRLKIREEIETEVDSFQRAKSILEALGMSVCFEYGKYREKLLRRGEKEDVEVCIDETPVGCFVEIEGSASAIEEVAKRMDWSKDRFINKNYIDLYREQQS
jgi:adenylate cyclase class 2